MAHSACKLPPTRHFVREIFGLEPAVVRWRLLEAGTLRTFGPHPPCVMPQSTAAAEFRARDRRLCPEALRHEALDQLAHVVRERSHERHVRQRLVVELGEQRTMSAGGQSFVLSGRSPPWFRSDCGQCDSETESVARQAVHAGPYLLLECKHPPKEATTCATSVTNRSHIQHAQNEGNAFFAPTVSACMPPLASGLLVERDTAVFINATA